MESKDKNEEKSVFVYADNAATAPVMPQAVEACFLII